MPEPFIQQGQDLETFLSQFWTRQIATAEDEEPNVKNTTLPLARIKKVMKSDPEVKVSHSLPLPRRQSPPAFCAHTNAILEREPPPFLSPTQMVSADGAYTRSSHCSHCLRPLYPHRPSFPSP